MTLASILIATIAGGVLSVLAAAFLSFSWLGGLATRMVSFSVGVLLAAAFLDILPEASEGLSAETAGASVLIGLFAFFLLEKLALWRHDHIQPADAAAPSPAGMIIVLGDGLHNFVDGLLIAAAFLQDQALGIATAMAVVAHEIPEEVGEFMVLLAGGYSRARALALNVLSGGAAVLGGLLGYLALQGTAGIIPYALCIAAASFIYIAVADLVPLLQQHRRLSDTALQLFLMALGVGMLLAARHAHG